MFWGRLEESRGTGRNPRNLYQKALQIEPEYPVAANNLAYLLLEHGGNPDLALSYAQVARRGMPDSTDPLIRWRGHITKKVLPNWRLISSRRRSRKLRTTQRTIIIWDCVSKDQ